MAPCRSPLRALVAWSWAACIIASPWAPPMPFCAATFEQPVQRFPLRTREISEASGIVSSPVNPGILWLHNDSGNDDVLYAVSSLDGNGGRLVARVRLPLRLWDAEDAAARARCPQRNVSCIYVADVGDNGRSRDDLRVVAVKEPTVDARASMPISIVASQEDVTLFRFRYPEGKRYDCEAFIIAPSAKRFWVFTKDKSGSRVFTTPLGAGPSDLPPSTVTLIEINSLGNPAPYRQWRADLDDPAVHVITGADIHPTGRRLIVRTYHGTYEYGCMVPWDLGRTSVYLHRVVSHNWGPTGLREPQAEAIGYESVGPQAGKAIWTVSEGSRQALGYQACSE